MSALSMVVWIVGIVMVAQVVDSYLKNKAKQAASNTLGDETRGRIEDLEERIRVLERIVTEQKHDLKREINELR